MEIRQGALEPQPVTPHQGKENQADVQQHRQERWVGRNPMCQDVFRSQALRSGQIEDDQGEENQLDVQSERQAPGVLLFQLGLLPIPRFSVDRRARIQQLFLVAVAQRGKAGDARCQAGHFRVRSVSRQQLGHARPRPHQTHLAAEHVDQLRQLVDLEATKPPTQLRDPRVVAPGEIAHFPTGPRGHGAKLQQPEGNPMASQANLPEKDWARAAQLDQ